MAEEEDVEELSTNAEPPSGKLPLTLHFADRRIQSSRIGTDQGEGVM